jgi:hypothetical protein
MVRKISGVGIATGYRLDGPNSIPSKAKFSLLHSVQAGSGVHPASYPIVTRLPEATSPGVKRPESEADHSPSSITEVENAVAIHTSSTPAYFFMNVWRNYFLPTLTLA